MSLDDVVRQPLERFGIVTVSVAYTLSRGGWHLIVEGQEIGRHAMTPDEAQDFAAMYRSARERVGLKQVDEDFLKEIGRAIVRAREGNDAEGHTIQ